MHLEQCWLEAKLLLGLVVVPVHLEQRWRRPDGCWGEYAGSTPEDRGRTRSATNVNW